MSYLIVGLGNPGNKYEDTRHNIGWKALDNLSFHSRLNYKEKFKGFFAKERFAGEEVVFLRPQTFMNLSGESVQACSKFFKIPVENILVVYDELDLPYGTMVFKKGGGLAGHNGLKSIASQMGNQNFLRLRLGIGRPQHGNVASYVLSKFSNDEQAVFERYMEMAAEGIESFIDGGFEKAARNYSKKSILE